jgi:hypothetical protein
MEPREELERTATPRALAEHNVLASFQDLDTARAAIDALESAGLDASLISLLGPSPAAAAAEEDTTERDLHATGFVGTRAAVGGAIGAGTGATAGFLAGLAAFSIPGVGPVIGAGIWASTLAGAVAGGAVGGVVGGVSSVDSTPAWELTHESIRGGRAVVGVHSPDQDDVDRGEEVLRGEGPIAIERFDASGHPVKPS